MIGADRDPSPIPESAARSDVWRFVAWGHDLVRFHRFYPRWCWSRKFRSRKVSISAAVSHRHPRTNSNALARPRSDGTNTSEALTWPDLAIHFGLRHLRTACGKLFGEPLSASAKRR